MISCGVYRYPPEEASHIAVPTTRRELSGHELPERVVLVGFTVRDVEILRKTLKDKG